MARTENESMIRLALADTHRHLYVTNLYFKSTVDHLASMLPAMINGIAEEATKRQEEIEVRKAEMMKAPVFKVGESDAPVL